MTVAVVLMRHRRCGRRGSVVRDGSRVVLPERVEGHAGCVVAGQMAGLGEAGEVAACGGFADGVTEFSEGLGSTPGFSAAAVCADRGEEVGLPGDGGRGGRRGGGLVLCPGAGGPLVLRVAPQQ